MWYIHPHVYDAIWIEGTAHGIEHYLLAALLYVESGMNPHAVGDGGQSFGLGQLHLRGAGAGYDPSYLLDIDNNVRIAASYLKKCIEETGTVEDGVSAYNQGVFGWRQAGRRFNANYVASVMNTRETFALEGLSRMTDDMLWIVSH